VRRSFVAELDELMGEDRRVVLLTADLGYSVLEPLGVNHPGRVINVGAAEQNMMGVAAGLAHSGLIPFTYSIATFATLRGYEFVRGGAIVHGLPVRIVGIGGGFEYGAAGVSHYALEDLGLMRAQPGMTVIAPADGAQARAALRATWDLPGPVYYRIGKVELPPLLELAGRFRLGRLEQLLPPANLVMIASGAAARLALAACTRLREAGVECSLAVAACLAPEPRTDLIALLSQAHAAVTVETHYRENGLGSLVAQVIAEEGLGCRLVRAGVDSVPQTYVGSQPYMESVFGLDTTGLMAAVNRARGVTPSL